ncbi:hypothetical protein ISG33_05720 [Glaciecola sp. MH2013]|uniref:hypothetical protein n=1 Tax=Glaciecola sp. MH2013 TaxID=2785524 RepID=UPI00189E5484|nr:hypothetical protein [Glaciecola sp. MH2013]MBF7072896.1 hypothetical protein [Glaciecola sp. MH2013]
MPAPLLWLGAACIGLYASSKVSDSYKQSKSVVAQLPGDSNKRVSPKNGAVVCCGIYGVLDHTGIWVDGNIYELSGAGLIRCISPQRFLQNRSGDTIYLACDQSYLPLANEQIAERCINSLYQVREYDLLDNNCHKFVMEMLLGREVAITSFSELNQALSNLYLSTISWHQLKM